jgi:signal transduction histidine kinase
MRSRDELAELADSLNQMCNRLAQSQTKIREETAARVSAMEQLRHADRLRTVGRLASGLAHEMGTPLNVISGRAELIASGKLSAEEVVQSAGAIKAESEKITAVIRQLLDFARRTTPQRVVADLCQIVSQTLDLLSPLAEKQRVSLEVVEADRRQEARVDVGQIQQVLTNLILNAIQAMPDGGTVSIDLRHARTVPPGKQQDAEANYRCIRVRDEGVGISEETMQHLFEPFFTTKDVGEGTGLGLSIAYGIVQEHDGWIEASSEPGSGTCFSVYLPEE